MDDLREIPGRDALKLRAEASLAISICSYPLCQSSCKAIPLSLLTLSPSSGCFHGVTSEATENGDGETDTEDI